MPRLHSRPTGRLTRRAGISRSTPFIAMPMGAFSIPLADLPICIPQRGCVSSAVRPIASARTTCGSCASSALRQRLPTTVPSIRPGLLPAPRSGPGLPSSRASGSRPKWPSCWSLGSPCRASRRWPRAACWRRSRRHNPGATTFSGWLKMNSASAWRPMRFAGWLPFWCRGSTMPDRSTGASNCRRAIASVCGSPLDPMSGRRWLERGPL